MMSWQDATRWLDRAAADGTSCDEALAIFDALPAVPVEAMRGHWRGGEVPTGHLLDGLLATFGWHGKTFVDSETVHPLVFRRADGRRVSVDPWRIPLGLARFRSVVQHPMAAALFRLMRPLLETRAPRARLRAMACRGVVTATMVYDHLPIADAFRQVDDRRVLGLMDWRGHPPYFFWLEREEEAA